MAKLTLKFDERVLNEYGLEEQEVTIGRLPGNTILIDNPAVSGHHARIVREGDRYIVEDLRSKNGTYVNQKHVVRQVLEDRDVVLVGKHKLVFSGLATVDGPVEQRVVPTLGATAYLDTKAHRALLNRLREVRAAKAASSAMQEDAGGSPSTSTASLRVLAGPAASSEYPLTMETSLIGKSDVALVRLLGWFKPRTAAAIMREEHGYALYPMGAKAIVNGERVQTRRDLKNGDLIDVAGVVLEFRSSAASRDHARSQTNVA